MLNVIKHSACANTQPEGRIHIRVLTKHCLLLQGTCRDQTAGTAESPSETPAAYGHTLILRAPDSSREHLGYFSRAVPALTQSSFSTGHRTGPGTAQTSVGSVLRRELSAPSPRIKSLYFNASAKATKQESCNSTELLFSEGETALRDLRCNRRTPKAAHRTRRTEKQRAEERPGALQAAARHSPSPAASSSLQPFPPALHTAERTATASRADRPDRSRPKEAGL